MENEEEKNEKRHYLGKPNSDIVNVPVLFRKNAFSPTSDSTVLDTPMMSYRIFFKILNDVSNDQFQREKQPIQFDLFEKDFATVSNTYGRFTFKVSDIDENKDYTSIKKGLDFLENLHKDWYKSVNKKGKIVRTQFGVISSPAITDGKITFLMAAHWLKQILEIPHYNPTFFQTAWEFQKGKQFIFYLWLLEVPLTGTRINFRKFQKIYGYNYKNAQDFNKNVLKTIKNKLDKVSNVSFNYSAKGDMINIVPYSTKDIELSLKKDTISNQKITQKLHYWKTRHNLSDNNIKDFRSILSKDKSIFKLLTTSYESLVYKCNKDKKKVVFFQEDAFIDRFQNEIIECYKTSAWYGIKGMKDAYPRIK